MGTIFYLMSEWKGAESGGAPERPAPPRLTFEALLLYLWAIFTQEPFHPAVALVLEVWDGVRPSGGEFPGGWCFRGDPVVGRPPLALAWFWLTS